PTYRRRRWGRVPGMAGAMLALVVMFDRAQMIHSGTHRGAVSAADPVMSAPLARVHAALAGLLDGCTCLAVGWRAGNRPACTEDGGSGADALDTLHRVLAGEATASGDIVVEAWEKGDVRLAAVLHCPGRPADSVDAWRTVARTLLEGALHSADLQARVQQLEQS